MTNATRRLAYLLDDRGQMTSTPSRTTCPHRARGSFVTATPYRFALNSLRVTASHQCFNLIRCRWQKALAQGDRGH
jgi:hypothetical protein